MSNDKVLQHEGLVVIKPLREIERVVAPMRERVGSYARLIQELFGESGKALTVFGAVLIDGFNVDRDTVRSVLVVERIELSLLRRLADRGAKLGKTGVAAPLIMTPDHIRTSLDTFPLELMEIQQQHVTLFGQDYFNELTFENVHVRLQCERELKRILIGMRQGLLASAGRERLVPMMGKDAADDLVRTLRGLLWLKGHKEFKDAIEVVAQIETLTTRKLPGLRTAVHSAMPAGWKDFDHLYHDVEALGEIVNAW
jgi:hypothetical protein